MEVLKLIILTFSWFFFLLQPFKAQVKSVNLNKTVFQSKRGDMNDVQNRSNLMAISSGLNQTYFAPQEYFINSISILSPPPLTFEGEGVNWAVIDQDTTFLSNSVYTESRYSLNVENNYIIDNAIYNIYSSGLRAGSYISKRNIDTGQLMWEQSSNLSNNERIELDLSLHEREDGNVESYGFRLLSTNVPNITPTGVVNRKVFNSSTGELLSQHFTEFEEDGVHCININGQLGSTFPITEDQKYFTNCSYGSQRQTLTNELNGDGLFTDSIGISGSLLESDGPLQTSYAGAKRLSNGNIAVPVSVFNRFFTLDEILSEVLILNTQGELIRRIDVTEIMDFATDMAIETVDDKIILTGSSFQELIDQQFIFTHNIAVIDEMGEVFTQINNIDEYINIRSSVTENGELIAVGRAIDDNCAKILREKDGQLVEMESLCHLDKKWYLSNRNIAVDDERLIISGIITRDTMTFDINSGNLVQNGIGVAPVVLSFDLDKLTGTVSTQGASSTPDKLFIVSPNPAADVINIQFEATENGKISLFNQLGKRIIHTDIQDIQQYSLALNNVFSGIYYIRFENENILSTQKIIIAK